MAPPRRRTLLQNFGAGLALVVAGCTGSGTDKGVPDPSETTPSTPSPTASFAGDKKRTPADDEDLKIFNDTETRLTVDLRLSRSDTSKTLLEETVTLHPKSRQTHADSRIYASIFTESADYHLTVRKHEGGQASKTFARDPESPAIRVFLEPSQIRIIVPVH